MQQGRWLRLFNLSVAGERNSQIYGLIFWSGFCSLIYEIVWIRQAAFIFGSSAIALSTVLGMFFLGLGLGSSGIGRLSSKIRRPLLWCATVEILLALNGLLSPVTFAAIDSGYGHIYREFELASGQLLIFRAALVALMVLLPAVCMGSTLPLFCKQLIHDSAQISKKLGLIYGINTLGAALGCALTGYWLLPEFGMRAALQIAAALNLAVGFGFWRLHSELLRKQTISRAPIAPEPLVTKPVTPLFLAALLLFLTGITALANELIWARFLSHFIKHSVYSYTLALTIVLSGTAAGSIWLGIYPAHHVDRHSLWLRFAVLQILSALLLQALTHLPGSFWQAIKSFGVAPFGLLMLPSAIIAGISFPLLNRLVIPHPDLAARQVGLLTGINIAGCVLGSTLTGYLLLPHYGLDLSITASGTISMLAGLLALGFGMDWRTRPGTIKPAAYLTAYGLVLVWLGLIIFPPVRIPQDFIATEEQLLAMEEGYNSNLAVVMRGEEKTLLVDRLWQGVGNKNYQVMVAHIPMFHYPEARNVLVVGLGAGTTASRFLYYDIQGLDIVDIEPRLFAFTRQYFDAEWMDDPRVRTLAEDGRNYIKHTQRQYDVISVEIGQLDRPGVGVFYTKEFYQEARARLRPRGIISQFVPLPFLTPQEFAGILRTFLNVFPQAALWYNTEELILLGFKDEQQLLSAEKFAQVVNRPLIKEDINMYYWGGSQYLLNEFPVFLGSFLASGPDLQALAAIAKAEIYTDDKLQLSYTVNNYKRSDQRALKLVPYLQDHLSEISSAVTPRGANPPTLQRAALIRTFNVADIAASDLLSQLNTNALGQVPDLATIYDYATLAVQWNPYSLNAQRQAEAAFFEMDRQHPARPSP